MRRDRQLESEHLVDGLTLAERLARLEGDATAIARDTEAQRRRIEDLESAVRRLQLPRLLSWFLSR